VESSCEHGNEPSGSVKYWEVLEWLHNWQFLKKGSTLQVGKYVKFEMGSFMFNARLMKL
jgi:hypothetical protein